MIFLFEDEVLILLDLPFELKFACKTKNCFWKSTGPNNDQSPEQVQNKESISFWQYFQANVQYAKKGKCRNTVGIFMSISFFSAASTLTAAAKIVYVLSHLQLYSTIIATLILIVWLWMYFITEFWTTISQKGQYSVSL